MDELKCMLDFYVLCLQTASHSKQPLVIEAMEATKPASQQPAVAKKEPPAKKVVEPPSAELLAKHGRVVAIGEECLEKEELLTLMQFKPTSFRL